MKAPIGEIVEEMLKSFKGRKKLHEVVAMSVGSRRDGIVRFFEWKGKIYRIN